MTHARAGFAWAWIEQSWADGRYAARSLCRSGAFTLTAVASLALGIGAASTVLTVADRLLWRPLPVASPSQLVTFEQVSLRQGRSDAWPYPTFQRLRGLDVFAGIAATAQTERATADGELVTIGLVSGSYFSTLGLRAPLGRTLAPADDSGGAEPVAVISDRWWERAWNRDFRVVGRTFTINGTAYTIIGVAPPAFTGDVVGVETDAWLPMSVAPRVMVERPDLLEHPSSNWTRVIARLRDGVSPAQARAAVAAAVESGWSDTQRQDRHVDVRSIAHGFSFQRDRLEPVFTGLSAIVVLVLLMVCVNLAALLMSRGVRRQREIAVRLAIGASRPRVARQLLAEVGILAIAGAAGGLLFAVWAIRALVALESTSRLSVAISAVPDGRMFALTAACCLPTALSCGLWPAVRLVRRTAPLAVTVLRGGRTTSGPFRFGTGLVVAQIALALALVGGAGLFVRTVRNLEGQPVGFDRGNALLFWLSPAIGGKQASALAPFFAAAAEQAASLPGVRSASASSDGVMSGFIGIRTVSVPARSLGTDDTAQWNLVAPKFFETIGMRLLAGRDFTRADSADSSPVAVVNQAMARHFFGEANPVGQHFSFGSGAAHAIEVVGVVDDAKYFSLRDADTRMVFLPFTQDVAHLFRMCIVVRPEPGSSAAVTARVREVLRALDASIPLRRVDTTESRIGATITEERLIAWVAGACGGLSLLLAAVGIYGVTAVAMDARTKEFGIRSALGATRADILRQVLGQTAILIAAGAVVSIPCVAASGMSARSLLFGVQPHDPLTLGAAFGILAIVALAAAFIPARRASHLDAAAILRAD